MFGELRPALKLHAESVSVYTDTGHLQEGMIVGARIRDSEVLVTDNTFTTPAIHRVLFLGALGCKEKDTADILGLSFNTVSHRRTAGFKDLGVGTLPRSVDRQFEIGALTVAKSLGDYIELTANEQAVLELYRNGRVQSEVTELLDIPVSTLKGRRESVGIKSGLGSLAGAVLIDHLRHDEPKPSVTLDYLAAVHAAYSNSTII